MKIFELSGNSITDLDWVEAVILNKEEDHIETIEGLISDPEELYRYDHDLY